MHPSAEEIEQARRLLRTSDVVLLDMNGTFMFDEDRLDAAQDFGATYRALGGELLTEQRVSELVLATVDRMALLYEDPLFEDDFPSLYEMLDGRGVVDGKR